MVSITLSVPEELKDEMDKHPEMNWSEIARQAIREKMLILRKMEQLLSKSRLTENDVEQFAAKVKKNATKKFLKAIGN
ncbi:hypothetical protein HZA96_04470 [Candidatus Woesearchaeota archaeon]|nr:hypothetical protein [Candidatus Woesearchaeota archaeon]